MEEFLPGMKEILIPYLGGGNNVLVPSFLAHTKQKVSNIVGLMALRLAFFMGYE